MVLKLCLMAFNGCLSSGVVLPQDYGVARDLQSFSPCHGPRHEVMRLESLNFGPHELDEAWRPMSRLSDTHCFKIEPAVKLLPFTDVQDAHSSSMRFSSVISERCTRHEKILQILASGASEQPEGGESDIALLSELMGLQSLKFDDNEQSSPLIYPTTELYAQTPVLDFVGELVGSSRIIVHPDGRVLFNGTGAEVRDLISLVAEFYISKTSAKGAKHSMLIPHFRWRSSSAIVLDGSSLQATIAAPIKSSKKVKTKSPKKKISQKRGRVRNLYEKNYFHACESLLSIMADKRKCRKTAVLSLKKSGSELPELLNWFSASIAGIGLTVLFSVMCQFAYARVAFCSSKILSMGLGLGLFWLSSAVNKLRDTIVYASKNTGKLGLNEEGVMNSVDKSVKEIYIRAATLLVVAVLRFA